MDTTKIKLKVKQKKIRFAVSILCLVCPIPLLIWTDKMPYEGVALFWIMAVGIWFLDKDLLLKIMEYRTKRRGRK